MSTCVQIWKIITVSNKPIITFSASYSVYRNEMDLGKPCRALWSDARGLSISGSVNALKRVDLDIPDHQRSRKIEGRTIVLYDFMSRF